MLIKWISNLFGRDDPLLQRHIKFLFDLVFEGKDKNN